MSGCTYVFMQVCAMNHNENILNANAYHLNDISIMNAQMVFVMDSMHNPQ